MATNNATEQQTNIHPQTLEQVRTAAYHRGYYLMPNDNPYPVTEHDGSPSELAQHHWAYEAGYREGKELRNELSRTRRYR